MEFVSLYFMFSATLSQLVQISMWLGQSIPNNKVCKVFVVNHFL
jgi:hypothetical protein